MARVTVEDCLDKVSNRFELVLLATRRTRQLEMGKEPFVPWENDKAPVVALREIAEGLVDDEIMNKIEARDLEVEEDLFASESEEDEAAPPPAESV